MVLLNARKLDIQEARRMLNFEPRFGGSFQQYLQLAAVAADEQQELTKIVEDFRTYYLAGKVSEGQVRCISVAPLLRLAGYHGSNIELKIEEDIARICVTDEDTYITGRFDIVAVHRHLYREDIPLWILIIESKNSEASESTGIAQMLAYAHKSLETQDFVWSLVTNGDVYQFFYLQKGDPSIYEYMPSLNMREDNLVLQILQVLKAIRQG
jgi:hypothetical protein